MEEYGIFSGYGLAVYIQSDNSSVERTRQGICFCNSLGDYINLRNIFSAKKKCKNYGMYRICADCCGNT